MVDMAARVAERLPAGRIADLAEEDHVVVAAAEVVALRAAAEAVTPAVVDTRTGRAADGAVSFKPSPSHSIANPSCVHF